MLNIIKMDLYRMLKAKSTYIIILGICLVSLMLLYQSHEALIDLKKGIPVPELSVGIGNDVSALAKNPSILALFYSIFGSFTIALGLSVFSILFITREESTGFIKNIAGQVSSRSHLVISKLVCQSAFILLSFLTSMLTAFFAGKIFFDSLEFGSPSIFWKPICLQFLLHIAFATILLMLVFLIKQLIISLLISITLCFGVFSYLYALISKGINHLFEINGFDISNYTITGNIGGAASNMDYMRIISVSIVYIIIMLLVSILIRQKQDIK